MRDAIESFFLFFIFVFSIIHAKTYVDKLADSNFTIL